MDNITRPDTNVRVVPYKEKVHFNVRLDDGGVIMTSNQASSMKLALRVAGNPKFILTEFKEFYGEREGEKRYKELLGLLHRVSQKGWSPFVLYRYE